MKRVKNIFFIFIVTFAMIALASCTIIDDTHIHRFEDGVCDCGDLETNYPEVKKYEVALVDGSNVIAKFEIMEGTLVPEVKAPVKLGQVFLGWFNGEVKWDFNKMPVASELVLEARYVDNAKYDIVYQLNGGEFAGEVETSYVSGIGLDKLPEPVRSNYIFLGWYLNGEKVESISSSQMGTLTLVAKWEFVNYDITYDFNGGISKELYSEKGTSTSRIEATSYNGNFWGEYTKAVFICTKDKDPKATWSDRIFIKLNTETGLYEVVSVLASGVTNAWPEGADYVIVLSGSHQNYSGLQGSFTSVSVGDVAVLSSGVTGASSGSPLEIKFFESAITEDTMIKSYHNGGELPSATKPGSTFLGWYDSSDKKYESVDEITEDITLIAKWS